MAPHESGLVRRLKGDAMPREIGVDRREFMVKGAAAAMAAGTLGAGSVEASGVSETQPSGQEGGSGMTASEDANAITDQTIAEAQKLNALNFTEEERAAVARGAARRAEQYQSRRASIDLPNDRAPALVFDPRGFGSVASGEAEFQRSKVDPGPVPASDTDIAYAPVTVLSAANWAGAVQSPRQFDQISFGAAQVQVGNTERDPIRFGSGRRTRH